MCGCKCVCVCVWQGVRENDQGAVVAFSLGEVRQADDSYSVVGSSSPRQKSRVESEPGEEKRTKRRSTKYSIKSVEPRAMGQGQGYGGLIASSAIPPVFILL